MYAFTGDTMYKEKAKEVADKLLPAFDTPTGLPRSIVNVGSGVSGSSTQNNFFSNFIRNVENIFFPP